jgi:hypothetical protein
MFFRLPTGLAAVLNAGGGCRLERRHGLAIGVLVGPVAAFAWPLLLLLLLLLLASALRRPPLLAVAVRLQLGHRHWLEWQ